jgi:hypothetical protein
MFETNETVCRTKLIADAPVETALAYLTHICRGNLYPRNGFAAGCDGRALPCLLCAFAYFASLREIALSQKAFTQRRKGSRDAKKLFILC